MPKYKVGDLLRFTIEHNIQNLIKLKVVALHGDTYALEYTCSNQPPYVREGFSYDHVEPITELAEPAIYTRTRALLAKHGVNVELTYTPK